MVKYILIVEFALAGRKVYAYKEEHKDVLSKIEEYIKLQGMTYEIFEIGELGFCSKIRGEQYDS